MTPEDYEKFGLSPEEGDALSRWILPHVGYVLGSNGRGGSGVFVQTLAGRTALLTARHVLVPAILSGEITIGHYLSGKARSIEPTALRMARHSDAALVFVPEGVAPDVRLPPEAWDPRRPPGMSKGDGVILSGAPGEWKAEPDLERRIIESMQTLLFWTAITDPNDGGLVVCDVDESIGALPKSFKGMSGGPVFNLNRDLIGMNKGERRTKPDGIVAVTSRATWEDLFYSFELPAGGPEMFRQRVVCLPLDAKDADARRDQSVVRVTFIAELFESPDRPSDRYGAFGRVVCLIFGTQPRTSRYRVNVESIFFPASATADDWKTAFREEAGYMLRAMEYEDVTPRA
jgi:hypothetical protein